jgi:erythromycin esterase-like protein
MLASLSISRTTLTIWTLVVLTPVGLLGCDTNGSYEAPDASLDASNDVADITPDTAPQTILPGVYPVDTIDFDAETAAFAPLVALSEQADIIGLGETIHYSDGYSDARAKMIRVLVEDAGLRTVAFEGSWATASSTRSYLLGEHDSIDRAMSGLQFSAWFADANRELLMWLRQRNDSNPDDKVTIFGFDVQDPVGSGNRIRAAAKTLDDPQLNTLIEDLPSCPGAGFESRQALREDAQEVELLRAERALPDERDSTCESFLDEARAWVMSQGNALTTLLGNTGAATFRVALRSLRALLEMNRSSSNNDYNGAYNARDEAMADVFDLLRPVYADDGRVVFFGHNSHVMRNSDAIVIRGGRQKSIGSWLAERHEDAYAPVGLFAHEVAWNWPNRVGRGDWTPREDESVEAILNSLEEQYLFVDLMEATSRRSLFEEGRTYQMGHAPPKTSEPADHFDALFFMESSQARP